MKKEKRLKSKASEAGCEHKLQEVVVKRKITKQFCLVCKKMLYSW
jgi:hypothetical protein